MCNQNNSNQNKLIKKLTDLGFNETNGKFVKNSNSNSGKIFEAYINGTGIIFHLNSNGKCIKFTIQTVDDKDIDEAFREIKLFTEEMGQTT